MEKDIKKLQFQNLLSRINGVLGYIKDNPTSDPNLREMNEIMYEYDKIIQDRQNGDMLDYAKLTANFKNMMNFRLDQIEADTQDLGISTSDPLYKNFKDYLDCQTPLDQKSAQLYHRAIGINYWTKQNYRNLKLSNDEQGKIYDNEGEFNSLIVDIARYKEENGEKSLPNNYLDKWVNEASLALNHTTKEYDELQRQKEQDDIAL